MLLDLLHLNIFPNGTGYAAEAEDRSPNGRRLVMIACVVDVNKGNSQANPDIEADCRNPMVSFAGFFPQEVDHSSSSKAV